MRCILMKDCEKNCAEYQLPAVYLFGSYTRRTATQDGDIDPITVSALQQPQMESDMCFRDTVWKSFFGL